MARTRRIVDLAAIESRREALRKELVQLDAQARVAEERTRDAGRTLLLAALDRVKIAAMDKVDARAIASAIAGHGGKAVASALASLD